MHFFFFKMVCPGGGEGAWSQILDGEALCAVLPDRTLHRAGVAKGSTHLPHPGILESCRAGSFPNSWPTLLPAWMKAAVQTYLENIQLGKATSLNRTQDSQTGFLPPVHCMGSDLIVKDALEIY